MTVKNEVACPKCNRDFQSVSSLRMHWARMHKSMGTLDSHLQGDTSDNVKPFGNILDNVVRILQDAGREMSIQEIVSVLRKKNPTAKHNASYISTMVRKNPSSGIVRQSRGRYALSDSKPAIPRPTRKYRKNNQPIEQHEPVLTIDPVVENEILRRQLARNEEILMKMTEALMLAIR